MVTALSILLLCSIFFFFNDTATTEIYTLSLHDALPISVGAPARRPGPADQGVAGVRGAPERGQRDPHEAADLDRKSTRLNSSHSQISYAVFCLKKKTTFQCRPTLSPDDPRCRSSTRPTS